MKSLEKSPHGVKIVPSNYKFDQRNYVEIKFSPSKGFEKFFKNFFSKIQTVISLLIPTSSLYVVSRYV